MSRFLTVLLGFAWLLRAAYAADTADKKRYLAVFADGSRVQDDALSGWQTHPGDPKIGQTKLQDKDRPLRWLRNRSLRLFDPLENSLESIEFIGGDRLPGRVIGFYPAKDNLQSSLPAHLMVETDLAVVSPVYGKQKSVRVLPNNIRRIVWATSTHRALEPGTLFLRSGAKVSFRRLRWMEKSIDFLTTRGVREVPFEEIAEVHFPQRDPWEVYYKELAVLSSDGSSRLVRLETTDGLVATGSESLFRAQAHMTHRERAHAAMMAGLLQKEIWKVERAIDNLQTREQEQKKKDLESLEKSRQQAKANRDRQYKQKVEQFERQNNKKEKDFNRKWEQELKRITGEEKRKRRQLKNLPAAKREQSIKQFHENEIKKLEERKKRDEKQLKDQIQQQQKELVRWKQEDQRTRVQSKQNRQRLEQSLKQSEEQRRQKVEQIQRRLFSLKQKGLSWGKSQTLANRPDRWTHILRPAWSLDPIGVPFKTIRTRWSFAPHEVPLSRIAPSRVVQRSSLGKSWTWKTDRNVQGLDLKNAGLAHGWGFGVHAANELHFPLPNCARSFHSRIGLDKLAGAGGCVRASVLVNSAEGTVLYKSKLLVGSSEILNTGKLNLSSPGDDQKTLVLLVDEAHEDRPHDADPLDIRDILDWIEPTLLLDPAKLQKQVRKYVPKDVASKLARQGDKNHSKPTGKNKAPAHSVAFEGHHYLVVYQWTTWPGAKKICESMGGRLVSIETEKEAQFVAQLVGNQKLWLWLGGFKKPDGSWHWINSKPMTFTFWDVEEPNNYGGRENCVIIRPNGRWHDIEGAKLPFAGFICEWGE